MWLILYEIEVFPFTHIDCDPFAEPYLHISAMPSYTEPELIPVNQVKGIVWYMFLVSQVFTILVRADHFVQ